MEEFTDKLHFLKQQSDEINAHFNKCVFISPS